MNHQNKNKKPIGQSATPEPAPHYSLDLDCCVFVLQKRELAADRLRTVRQNMSQSKAMATACRVAVASFADSNTMCFQSVNKW